MASISAEAAFCRLVNGLGPYRDDVVIIGGWAAQLYHHHPKAIPQTDKPLMTTDADIYVRQHKLDHQPKLDERLKAVGFEQKPEGGERPPVLKYILPESRGFYIEFLTETRGSGTHRDGARNVTVAVEGVTAQKLDYLDLARLQPWEVGPITDAAYDWPEGVTVKIVNPACYIAQKILIHNKRRLGGKGSKDLLYVYDAIVRFADHLPELAATWRAMQTPQMLAGNYVKTTLLGAKDVKQLQKHRQIYFETMQDTHRQAASLVKAAGRNAQPDADEILSVLQAGLQTIFSP